MGNSASHWVRAVRQCSKYRKLFFVVSVCIDFVRARFTRLTCDDAVVSFFVILRFFALEWWSSADNPQKHYSNIETLYWRCIAEIRMSRCYNQNRACCNSTKNLYMIQTVYFESASKCILEFDLRCLYDHAYFLSKWIDVQDLIIDDKRDYKWYFKYPFKMTLHSRGYRRRTLVLG